MESKPIKEALQKIILECQESGATKWQALKMLKELESFQGGEAQLRKKAAEILEKLNPEAAKTFRSFERLRVFTSREKREAFDRGNIIKSLLKETGVSRAVAEKIGSEVEDKIKDLKIEYLNTQLIREMVDVKLLEYGHEHVHREYARLGMPVFEVAKRLSESAVFENPEILREYNWLEAIPEKARELHFDSFIHVFAPEDFSTKIFSFSMFLEGSVEDAAIQAASMDRHCTHPATLKAFNYSLALSCSATGKKIAAETGRALKVLSLTGKKRSAEIALFSDFEWGGFSHRKKDALRFANALLRSGENSAAEFPVSVDSRYKLKLLEKGIFSRGVKALNNSLAETTLYPFGVITGSFKGLLQLTALNLAKIAESAGNDEKSFLEKAGETADAVIELEESKKKALRKRPYFGEWMLEKTCGGLALSGLYAACALVDPKAPEKIAEALISALQKKGFVVLETPAEISQKAFGVSEEMDKTQEMLLRMGPKQKKSFGFAYAAGNLKEAERLLGEVPCVEIIPRSNQG